MINRFDRFTSSVSSIMQSISRIKKTEMQQRTDLQHNQQQGSKQHKRLQNIRPDQSPNPTPASI